MNPVSTKPYFLRALYQWCTDNGYTPYLVVSVDSHTRVPQEFVRDGEIVLNINRSATRGLTIENEWIFFSARFAGQSREIAVPVARVVSLFAKETGEGMTFNVEPSQPPQADDGPPDGPDAPTPRGRPTLKVVK